MVVADLLPPNIFLGVSLIIPQDGRFLFGIRPPKFINNQEILEITGIGGRLELSDHSLTDCAQREASEEIAAQIKILPMPRTLVVRGDHSIEEVELQGDERPAAIVFRGHRTPPHSPWDADRVDSGCIAVFLAELAGRPLPSPEIPCLIWLSPELILQTARFDLSLAKLFSAGARMSCILEATLPSSTLVRLTDSQEALSLALGEKTIPFYRSLC